MQKGNRGARHGGGEYQSSRNPKGRKKGETLRWERSGGGGGKPVSRQNTNWGGSERKTRVWSTMKKIRKKVKGGGGEKGGGKGHNSKEQ